MGGGTEKVVNFVTCTYLTFRIFFDKLYIDFFEVLAGYLASEAPNYGLRSRKEIARKLRVTIGNQEKDSDRLHTAWMSI